MGKDHIWKLEQSSLRAEQLSNMANALYDAMFEGPNSAEGYGDAFSLFNVILREHEEELSALFKAVHQGSKEVPA